MNADKTALILIGYQKDYFAEDGILRSAIEESAIATDVLSNTEALLRRLWETTVLMLETPIIFSEGYEELSHPVGLLKVIKEVGAFRVGSPGAETIPMVSRFGTRINTIPGKDGFNAFANTQLEQALKTREIEEIVLAGAVTSICIDSTGRSAHERGYRVTVLSDCTCGRTNFEQAFYCEQILPLYARVCTSDELLTELAD